MLNSLGFFMLRTPALPWNAIEEWSYDVSAAESYRVGTDIETSLASDTLLLRERLRGIIRQPVMQSALYLASPDLFTAVNAWLDGDDIDKTCRIESSIIRYFMRMAGRATPFGLLAGISTGTVTDRTSLRVSASTENLHHIRLDAEYIFKLTNYLLENRSIRDKVQFLTTASSFETCGRLRYYEPYEANKSIRFRLVDVQRSSFLLEALSFARYNDGVVIADIVEHITSSFPDVTSEQAIEFVEALISTKLLNEMWSPPVTGTDPALYLIEELKRICDGGSLVFDLCTILEKLEAIKWQPPETRQKDYQQINTCLSSIFPETDSVRKIRSDLHKSGAGVSLSSSIIEHMKCGIELLARIALPKNQSVLDIFIRKFEQRYQDSEVPLLQALDEDSGIGFDVELDDMTTDVPQLTEGIPFFSPHGESGSWDTLTGWLYKRLCASLRNRDTELVLSDDEIENLCITTPHFPTGMSILATIASASAEAADQGEYQIYLRKAFGPNSAKLMARFCHGDPDLLTYVKDALRREEALDSNAIHAEIVHLPHHHAANVISRPLMREYEIPLFSRSGAPSNNQIPLDDLLIAVVDGIVVLRSARYGRRVIPHLTCAHAYRKSSLGIYRFLASLEEQGTWSELTFSWGLLSSAPYLPRVVSGRFILSLAQWKLQGKMLRQISTLSWSTAFRKLQDLRMQLELPRFVMLTDGDNALPIDFENVLSLRSFMQVGKKLSTVVLTEQFPPPDKLIAKGEEGYYHHELVVPYIRASPTEGFANVLTDKKVSANFSSARMSYPGSDWLYIKVYCSISASERFLSNVVSQLVTVLRSEGSIEQWFFVRYKDPELHLRLRFRGQPERLWNIAEPIIFTHLADAGELVRSFSIETYFREENRYGGPHAIDIAEHIFEADSDAALTILMTQSSNLDDRWKLVLIGMDAFLNDFGFSLLQKKKIVNACRDSLASVLRVNHHLRPYLDHRYRTLKQEIQQLLSTHNHLELQASGEIQKRSEKISIFVEQLQHLECEGILNKPLTIIAESYLHMWANRIFRSAANTQEFMLYDFLSRFYSSQLARERTCH